MKKQIDVEFKINPSDLIMCFAIGEVSIGDDHYNIVASGASLEIRPKAGTSAFNVRVNLETIVRQAIELSKAKP